MAGLRRSHRRKQQVERPVVSAGNTKWHDLAQIIVRGRFRSYDTGAPLQHRWSTGRHPLQTLAIARERRRVCHRLWNDVWSGILGVR